jgi:hypothetical protein
MMRWIGNVSLCLLLLSVAPISHAGPFELLQEMGCERARDQLLSVPQAHVLAAARPEVPSLTKPVWSISLHGVSVPVMIAEYDQVHIQPAEDGVLVALISKKEGVAQSWFSLLNARLGPDAMVPGRPHARPFDWFVAGFQADPKELDCAVDTEIDVREVLIGLFFKVGMLPNAADVAYLGHGLQPAVATLGFVERHVWQYAWYAVDDGEAILQVSYTSDVEQARPPVVLAMGKPGSFDVQPSPMWLQRLEAAYASGAPGRWQEFFSEARAAGFDEKFLKQAEQAVLLSEITTPTETRNE